MFSKLKMRVAKRHDDALFARGCAEEEAVIEAETPYALCSITIRTMLERVRAFGLAAAAERRILVAQHTGGALMPLLSIAGGFEFARLIGIFPHDRLKPRDKGQGPA